MRATWTGFASVLAADIEDYLQYKRALKRRFRTEESVLRLLDRYLVKQQIDPLKAITPAVIDAFLQSRPRHKARSYNHLLGVTRCFLIGWSRSSASSALQYAPEQSARRGRYGRFYLPPRRCSTC